MNHRERSASSIIAQPSTYRRKKGDRPKNKRLRKEKCTEETPIVTHSIMNSSSLHPVAFPILGFHIKILVSSLHCVEFLLLHYARQTTLLLVVWDRSFDQSHRKISTTLSIMPISPFDQRETVPANELWQSKPLAITCQTISSAFHFIKILFPFFREHFQVT